MRRHMAENFTVYFQEVQLCAGIFGAKNSTKKCSILITFRTPLVHYIIYILQYITKFLKIAQRALKKNEKLVLKKSYTVLDIV